MYGRDPEELAETSRYTPGRGGVSPGVLIVLVLLTAASSVFGALYLTRAMAPAARQQPVRIRELSVSPARIGAGGVSEIRMLWRGDPEAETVYSVPSGARVEGTGPIARLNAGTLEAGTYLLKATVTARDGRTADAYALFHVAVVRRPPETPTLTQTERRIDCENGRYRVKLHAESSDPDGDALTFRWTTSTGTLSAPQGPEVQISGSLPDGSTKLVVSAIASDGASDSAPSAPFETRLGFDANCD